MRFLTFYFCVCLKISVINSFVLFCFFVINSFTHTHIKQKGRRGDIWDGSVEIIII